MESPARELLTDPAPYRILKRCPSCHMTYRTAPGVQPCPSCGELEETSGPLRACMSVPGEGKTRLVRNWPLTLVGLLLIACGPVSWVDAALRLASHSSFASYLHRADFLLRRLPDLPVSPAFLAAAGTAVFSLGFLFLSLSKYQAVVKPRRTKHDGEEAEAAPLELGLPDWLAAKRAAAPEVTYTAAAKPTVHRGFPG